MNDESIRVICALLFDLDLAGFDEWLSEIDDCPAKRELTERRAKMVDRLKAAKQIEYNAVDDESCPALKRDAEFLKTQWLSLKKDAVALPLVKKEKARLANLPTAEEQYARWREIAADIRAAKPYIKGKAEIARRVRRFLVNSHDPRDKQFVKSERTIRDQI